jgi:hypothetical protein
MLLIEWDRDLGCNGRTPFNIEAQAFKGKRGVGFRDIYNPKHVYKLKYRSGIEFF